MSNLIDNIKNLRKITGAGFLDCKKALEESDNKIEKSIVFLRKKGLAKASNKSSRETKEGAIGVYMNNSIAIMLEVNTETDFAAKNSIFLDFVDQIGQYALSVNNTSILKLDKFLNHSFDGKKISEYFTEIIAKIGENIVLKRLSFINKSLDSEFFSYIHNPYRSNIGRICVILQAEVNNKEDAKQFGKNLCMHIAASKPLALDIDKLDISLVEKEKDIQLATIKSSGKADNIIQKILEGKMNKFFSEVTLLNQPYIFDTDKNVRVAVSEFSSNNLFNIINFELFVLAS
jgi:elongation factor Ts